MLAAGSGRARAACSGRATRITGTTIGAWTLQIGGRPPGGEGGRIWRPNLEWRSRILSSKSELLTMPSAAARQSEDWESRTTIRSFGFGRGVGAGIRAGCGNTTSKGICGGIAPKTPPTRSTARTPGFGYGGSGSIRSAFAGVRLVTAKYGPGLV